VGRSFINSETGKAPFEFIVIGLVERMPSENLEESRDGMFLPSPQIVLHLE